MKTKVTLSIDKEVYLSFKKFCEENAIMMSKRLENEMVKIMTQNKSIKKKGEDEKNN